MLTENQKDYLLDTFFINREYTGWRGIGIKLLETGKCIVPGDRCIWHGGVGNFITTKESDIAVGCLEYTFNMVHFKLSGWYTEIHAAMLEKLQMQADEINKKLIEISAL